MEEQPQENRINPGKFYKSYKFRIENQLLEREDAKISQRTKVLDYKI